VSGGDVRSLGRPKRIYRGYVFDLDGTVYLGDSLLPHAAETIMTFAAADLGSFLSPTSRSRRRATMPASSLASGCRPRARTLSPLWTPSSTT